VEALDVDARFAGRNTGNRRELPGPARGSWATLTVRTGSTRTVFKFELGAAVAAIMGTAASEIAQTATAPSPDRSFMTQPSPHKNGGAVELPDDSTVAYAGPLIASKLSQSGAVSSNSPHSGLVRAGAATADLPQATVWVFQVMSLKDVRQVSTMS
jgi:hypothetical protein